MIDARVSTWSEVKELAEKEAEKRLSGKIRELWVDTIQLRPRWEGGRWFIRLRVILEQGFLKKNGYLVSMEIDPVTGEVSGFEVKPAR